MENLITCSRVLYDKDINDKIEEITSLKKKLGSYEKPKVEYSNIEEWETTKKEAYQIIKNGLDRCIIQDTFEYAHMEYMGLTPNQECDLPYYIEQALNLIIKENNKGWAEKISYDIIYGINGFINGFQKTGYWDSIYSLGAEELSNLIYNNIIWQLDDDTHSPCMLDDIAVFTCKKCGKKDFYISNENICYDCDNNDSDQNV